MTRTVAVVYDGEVFRPLEPVDLPPNTRGRVTIADETGNSRAARRHAWFSASSSAHAR